MVNLLLLPSSLNKCLWIINMIKQDESNKKEMEGSLFPLQFEKMGMHLSPSILLVRYNLCQSSSSSTLLLVTYRNGWKRQKMKGVPHEYMLDFISLSLKSICDGSALSVNVSIKKELLLLGEESNRDDLIRLNKKMNATNSRTNGRETIIVITLKDWDQQCNQRMPSLSRTFFLSWKLNFLSASQGNRMK